MVGIKIVKQNITQLIFFNQTVFPIHLWRSLDSKLYWDKNLCMRSIFTYSRFTLMKMSAGDPFDTKTCDAIVHNDLFLRKRPKMIKS